jgi:AcrR family transcriptional regulator
VTLPKRKARELAQRKVEILTVAERLFARKGFFKTSMAEIAQEAEFSVGSLYQFFPSKEAVYVALMEEKFEEHLLVQRRGWSETTLTNSTR